ncbi:hypothetical protein Peur_033234 [Populus x canadensis]
MFKDSKFSSFAKSFTSVLSEVIVFREIPRDSLARDITAVRVISLNGPGFLGHAAFNAFMIYSCSGCGKGHRTTQDSNLALF